MTTPTTPRFTVLPMRFSADPATMIRFLEVLGAARVVDTAGEQFGTLRAATGLVAVHAAAGSDTGAQPGETQLCFMTETADAVGAYAESAGLQARVWDESYGRQAALTGPLGEAIWVNEEQRDLYGYRGHEGEPDGHLHVTAVRYSADFAADRAFFGALGFVPLNDGDDWWQALRGPGDTGTIGLHRPAPDQELARLDAIEPLHRVPLIGLGFETTEPLEALRDRLTAGGYPAQIVSDEAATRVHLTDPDGCSLEIHPQA